MLIPLILASCTIHLCKQIALGAGSWDVKSKCNVVILHLMLFLRVLVPRQRRVDRNYPNPKHKKDGTLVNGYPQCHS